MKKGGFDWNVSIYLFYKKDYETKCSINHRLNCNFYINYQYLIFL